MTSPSDTFANHLRSLALLGISLIIVSCSTATGYSPGLGLDVDNLRKHDGRITMTAELAPNILSTRADGPKLVPVISARMELGISDDVSAKAKAIIGRSVSDQFNYREGGFLGAELGLNYRTRLSKKTDLLLIPRFQIVLNSIWISAGYGGGLASLIRHRFTPRFAVYAGPLAYFGADITSSTERRGGVNRTYTRGGRALGGHLGISGRISKTAVLNLEVLPLYQTENYLGRGTWVPAAQITFGYNLSNGSRADKRRY